MTWSRSIFISFSDTQSQWSGPDMYNLQSFWHVNNIFPNQTYIKYQRFCFVVMRMRFLTSSIHFLYRLMLQLLPGTAKELGAGTAKALNAITKRMSVLQQTNKSSWNFKYFFMNEFVLSSCKSQDLYLCDASKYISSRWHDYFYFFTLVLALVLEIVQIQTAGIETCLNNICNELSQ